MASATFTTLDAFQKAVDAETNRIAAAFQALLDGVNAGMSQAEVDTLVAQGATLVTNLQAIGAGGPVVPGP